jgi:hypothetical protein
MDEMNDNDTIVYSLADVGDTAAVQPTTSTPARRVTTPVPFVGFVRTPERESRGLLESINFDGAADAMYRETMVLDLSSRS